jgi:hypothetical protein
MIWICVKCNSAIQKKYKVYNWVVNVIEKENWECFCDSCRELIWIKLNYE